MRSPTVLLSSVLPNTGGRCGLLIAAGAGICCRRRQMSNNSIENSGVVTTVLGSMQPNSVIPARSLILISLQADVVSLVASKDEASNGTKAGSLLR